MSIVRLKSEHGNGLGELLKPGAHQRPGYHTWNHEGKALAALSRFGENVRMPSWLSRIQNQGSVTESARSSWRAISDGGDTIYLRPPIYVLFMRKYGSRSWIPWLMSLTVDLVGVGATSQGTKLQKGRKTHKEIYLSVAEKDELVPRLKGHSSSITRGQQKYGILSGGRLECTRKTFEPVAVIGSLTYRCDMNFLFQFYRLAAYEIFFFY
ncbi:LOW QUALITY PROTEIN: hypothetical protein Cgig2_026362 [Carnegiea gigantea]|uniref:Peroxisomal membrane protein PEX16 n=1 Tax=Carnegiea gigantea TaxID=171969 RepID=A0A9Q1KEU3_9CARY|nr:LOW QUALITY PROTEIN: hypothetical protein Cgig2_026362 [Carnegiea gigantea]